MKKLTVILIAALSLAACKTVRYVPVETKTTVKEIQRDTVVQVQIEREAYKVRTRDTVSLLETKYTISRAAIDGSTGELVHALVSKEVAAVPVKTKIVDRTVEVEKPVPYEVVKIKEVEKTLTWWQTTQIWGGRAFGAILALLIVWLVLRFKRII